MRKKLIFYHHPDSINEATEFYVQVIKEAFSKSLDIDFIETTSLSLLEIKKQDIIFTITSNYFFKSKIKFPFNKTVFWSQGIGPEEYLLSHKIDIKYFLKNIIEFIAVNYCSLLFAVSEAMVQHYKKKYFYNDANFFVMPCFNSSQPVNKSSILYKKKNSFVYAGNLAKWQCVEESIKIFKEFQKIDKDASVCFLVKDNEKMNNLIKKYNITNVTINYVKLEDLQKELELFQYGFLIRENIKVNNVSTPTKMSSYLSSFVTPIVTDVIYDFSKNLKKYDSLLFVEDNISSKEIANTINQHSKTTNNFENDIEQIFQTYFNRSIYVKNIGNIAKKMFYTN